MAHKVVVILDRGHFPKDHPRKPARRAQVYSYPAWSWARRMQHASAGRTKR